MLLESFLRQQSCNQEAGHQAVDHSPADFIEGDLVVIDQDRFQPLNVFIRAEVGKASRLRRLFVIRIKL